MTVSTTTNAYLYFAADWEVSQVTNFDVTHLIRTVGKSGFLLYTQGSRRAEDGLFKVSFALRVSSLDALSKFIAEAGGRFGLTHWQPISEAEFYGAPFLGSRIVGFVEAAQIYGRANAVLRGAAESS